MIQAGGRGDPIWHIALRYELVNNWDEPTISLASIVFLSDSRVRVQQPIQLDIANSYECVLVFGYTKSTDAMI